MGDAYVSRAGWTWKALILVLCLWGLILVTSAARLSGSRQKLEVQKHLNHLNKPAVKSIESPDGDVIDCIRISHQPAFDHPYLKDHKIQMRPTYHPEGLFDDNKVSEKPKESSNPITQLWHVNGKCPEDTIPVRRTKKDDVLRASSVKRYGRKKHRTIPKPRFADPGLENESGHQHVIAYVEGDKYYGAKATINVWEPKIQQPNEFSLSQLWILGGSFGEDLNSIEAGWQSDPYQATGCYNLLCSGFIQINSEIAMGASISPVSGFRTEVGAEDLRPSWPKKMPEAHSLFFRHFIYILLKISGLAQSNKGDRLDVFFDYLKARGLDVLSTTISCFRNGGDNETADLLENVVYPGEITHCAAGVKWFKYLCLRSRNPAVDQDRLASQGGVEEIEYEIGENEEVIKKFHDVVRKHFRGPLKPHFNEEATKAAGFSPQWYQPLSIKETTLE